MICLPCLVVVNMSGIGISNFLCNQRFKQRHFRSDSFKHCINIPGTEVFSMGQTISVSPLFHQRARINFPMTFRTRMLHVGSSSFSVQGVVTDTEGGDVLMTGRHLLVAANVFTAQSDKLPEKIK